MSLFLTSSFTYLILTELHPLIAKSLWNGPVCHKGPAGRVDKHHGTGEVQNITYIHFTKSLGLLHTISTQHMLVKVGKGEVWEGVISSGQESQFGNGCPNEHEQEVAAFSYRGSSSNNLYQSQQVGSSRTFRSHAASWLPFKK